jgi:hypothetical protein
VKVGCILLRGIWGLAFATTANAAGSNLTLLHAGVQLSFKNLSDSLDEFQSLPCLTPAAAEHLANYQANSATVYQAFEKHYGGYMTSMQKPMQGNGRCEGGFDSVAKES